MRVLLVDDEPAARRRMRRQLDVHVDVEIVGEAGDGAEALELIEALHPDTVFLDVEMPEMNGLDVARTLGGKGPAIVFVTAYDQHALEAFDHCAIDYLVKPVLADRLGSTLTRLRKTSSVNGTADLSALFDKMTPLRPRKLAVKAGSKYSVLDVERIAGAIARHPYVALLAEGREWYVEDSLDALSEKLPADLFLRIHRSGLLNLNFLKELRHEGDRKYIAVLKNAESTEIPVSKERLPELKKRLSLESLRG